MAPRGDGSAGRVTGPSYLVGETLSASGVSHTRIGRSDRQARIDGTFTLRGVTKSVPLTVSYVVARGGERMRVRAAGTIDRAAFGVSFDMPGWSRRVPRLMRLTIDVDAVLAA
jgi:hypothetical protein